MESACSEDNFVIFSLLKKKKERKKVLHSSDSYWILQIENRVPPPYQLQDYPKRSEVYFKMSVTQFDTGTKLFCNHLPNYIPYIMKFLCHKVLCAARQSLLFICMLAENLIQSEFYSFFFDSEIVCAMNLKPADMCDYQIG